MPACLDGTTDVEDGIVDKHTIAEREVDRIGSRLERLLSGLLRTDLAGEDYRIHDASVFPLPNLLGARATRIVGQDGQGHPLLARCLKKLTPATLGLDILI